MLAWVGTAVGFVATLYVALRFLPSERVMKRNGGRGIVDLELARDPERARALLDTWGAEGVAAARESIRLDWWFIPTYTCFVAVGGLAVGKPGVSVLGPVAAAFDVVENLAMLRVLDGRYDAQRLATRAAAAKFAALGAAFLLLIFG